MWPMTIRLPDLPPADVVRAEISALKARIAELRALLCLAETRELARKVHSVSVRKVGQRPVRITKVKGLHDDKLSARGT